MAHPFASSPDNVSPGDQPPPLFETSRLRLRPWRDTDAPGPGEGPDADSLRFMPAGAQPGPDDFPTWLARRRLDMSTGADLHWCIADLATDTATSGTATSGTATSDASATAGPNTADAAPFGSMLGNVQIFGMGPRRGRFQGELGYWLRPGARGRGVIGEALPPVIAHAFRPVAAGGLGLVRLHAATDGDNHASQSILGSAGFSQCGADHQAWRRSDGSLSDGVYFELLASLAPAPGPAGAGGKGAMNSDIAQDAVEPVTLEGNGVRLRKWRQTDAERVAQACSDERTQHWLADSLPSPYTLEHARAYIAGLSEKARQGEGVFWCVADPKSDVCHGAVAVHHLHEALGTSGEIGYWAHPDARSRGVMSEAVRLAVRHAFIPRGDGGLGRKRLRLNAADGNSASQHIALASGFVEVGRDRQAEPLGDGTFADLVRFDLLLDEWESSVDRPPDSEIPTGSRGYFGISWPAR